MLFTVSLLPSLLPSPPTDAWSTYLNILVGCPIVAMTRSFCQLSNCGSSSTTVQTILDPILGAELCVAWDTKLFLSGWIFLSVAHYQSCFFFWCDFLWNVPAVCRIFSETIFQSHNVLLVKQYKLFVLEGAFFHSLHRPAEWPCMTFYSSSVVMLHHCRDV